MSVNKNSVKNILKYFFNWQVGLGIVLIALSALIYYVHYKIFHDAHHIFVYLLGDIAFVPIEVLMVTLIIHRGLLAREKYEKMKKLNMVIGAFFSEVGTELIAYFSSFDPEAVKIQKKLLLTGNWSEKEFKNTTLYLNIHTYKIEIKKSEVVKLRSFLINKRNFLLRLLENPSLLEHDTFTDLLWAVFHLTEELQHRKKINKCSKNDLEHIEGDIKRAYCLLVKEWMVYIKHLKKDYPYLFSLAVRTNPFDPDARPELT